MIGMRPRQLPAVSRDSGEATSRLCNRVDEEVHGPVLTSNQCLQELESLRELRTLQEGGDQASWDRGCRVKGQGLGLESPRL